VETVRLDFGGQVTGGELSLSGVACSGDFLFFAPDEGAQLIRLRKSGASEYGHALRLPLRDYLDLPGAPGDEVDSEGLAVTADAVWVVASHGGVRKRVKETDDPGRVPQILRQVSWPASRCVLLRIPLGHEPRDADGEPVLTATLGQAQATRLPDSGPGSLRGMLAGDEHLETFLTIPSKDNGLDVEGLAVAGDRVLLGLRGPVLRGWAIILQMDPRPDVDNPARLRLAPLDAGGAVYRKHFLDLAGLGVRDLAVDGDDLLILAGPTMLLDGPSRILRLRNGAIGQLPAAVHRRDLEQIGDDLQTGQGSDHPEAITPLRFKNENRLLIVYDSPAPSRVEGGIVRAGLRRLRR